MQKLFGFVKNMAVLASACICVLCAAGSLREWFAGEGVPAAEAGTRLELEEGSVPWEESSSVQEMYNGGEAPDDGVVPFHSDLLPGYAATPDPARNSGPVEEVQLDGGTPIDNFFVRDSTESGTDLAAELLESPDIHIEGDGRVEVLIYHTHTSEAYSESAPGFYYTDMETRTQNQDMNVVAAGEEMAKALQARGIGVVHDKTVNDTVYNGSYSRSWEVIQKNLKEYPDIQVTIDLHRDSMTTEEGVKYKPTAQIGGRNAAQAMLLAGCDASGDWGDFPDWRWNLRLILRVQQKAQEMYPGLMRPLSFSNSKYNMNATRGSMLIEVGTEVNTAAEAKYTGKLLGEVLAETLLGL